MLTYYRQMYPWADPKMERGSQRGTLTFPFIRRLGSFFWVQNFEFQYFFVFSEKLIFFSYEDLWINF